jgi:ribosomal protein S18 acetylase RimI-like enzyme
MRLKDLRPGWRTDFIVHRYGAVVEEHPSHLVVRTPANPSFYWGNCLILPAAPSDEELPLWLDRFDQHITRGQPESDHVAIGVDAPWTGQPFAAWRAAGFTLQLSTMLRLQPGQLTPSPRPPRGPAHFRALDLATERDALLEVETRDAGEFEPEGYREFRRRQHDRYLDMQRDGLLRWFGLWCEGTLAATCGLIRERSEAGVDGRFQFVTTHPGWRRRGLCTALIHAVSRFAFEQWRVGDVYMAADPEDVAIGIYRSLGYRDIDNGFGLQKNAPRDLGA